MDNSSQLANQSHPHYIPTDKEGNPLLQIPPNGTVIKDLQAIYDYMDPLTIPHGYKLSVLDSRYFPKDSYIEFKCYKGPTRHARSPGDCPFAARADRKSINDTWELTIQNPHHNHAPSTSKLSYHRPKKSRNKTSTISTSEATPQASKKTTTPSLTKRYSDLISRMKGLEEAKQNLLLDLLEQELGIAEMDEVTVEYLKEAAGEVVEAESKILVLLKTAEEESELNPSRTQSARVSPDQPTNTNSLLLPSKVRNL